MARYQQGHIYERFGAFHVRYYTTEIENGQPVRRQRSHMLCRKDEKHHSRTCKPVRQLCEDFMREINTQVPGRVNDQDLRVVDFWEQTYMPFIAEHKRYSTVNGYRKIWNQHLRHHFGARASSAMG
jgi:hypothetical protein